MGVYGMTVLTIRCRWDPLQVLVLEPVGALNRQTCPQLQSTLVLALNGTSSVCCDLSDIDFFGAAAADTLAAAHLHAAHVRRSFSIRGVSELAAWVLAVTGLDTILTID